MMSENKLVGVLNVIAQKRVFTDEDLMKLRILARQATIAYIHTRNLDELMKSEERFRKMGENIHDGLLIIEDGFATYINERAVEIYGYPADELKNMSHLELVIPEDREQMRQLMDASRQIGQMLGEVEFWIQRKDGSRRYVRTRTSTSTEGGKINQFIITTDITARKFAEDENKRKMMKYLLEDGRIYLVKEFRPSMSLEAFNDLLNLEYFGLVLSRTPKKDMLRSITRPFEHLWMGEQMEGEELFQKILSSIARMAGKSVVLIDRLDYLIFKYGFKETLAFIFKLRDQIYLKEHVVIVSMDTSTLKEEELSIMQKEMSEIELRQIPKPSEELFEIAQIIYDQNSSGLKPSYSEIGDELKLSKPTFRKRVRLLINGGYVVEITKGNRKVLELTQKGRSLFFK
jgi:PAS domain S-box-containing protein